MPEGASQVIVTAAYSFADEALNAGGNGFDIEKFEKFELRGYAEYGFTDWATVVLQPELRSKSQGDERSVGFGRVDFGLRARVWKNDFAVASIEVSASAPGQRDKLIPLNGGDTDWEFDVRALYGRGFDFASRHGFADIQLGFKHRVDEPADEVALDLTLGFDLTDDMFVMGQSFNRVSVGRAREPFTKTTDHKIALSGVYKFDGLYSVQAGFLATVAGFNVLQERGAFAAIWRRF